MGEHVTLRKTVDNLIEAMINMTAAERANAAQEGAPYLAALRRALGVADPMLEVFGNSKHLTGFLLGAFYVGRLTNTGSLPKISDNLGAWKQATLYDHTPENNPTKEQLDAIRKLNDNVQIRMSTEGQYEPS